MRAALCLMLVWAVCSTKAAASVQVKDGERSFPLRSIETLKGLMDVDGPVKPQLGWTRAAVVCQDPNLPQVFQPVCQEKTVARTFSRLVGVLKFRDACEICANPSCFGCLD